MACDLKMNQTTSRQIPAQNRSIIHMDLDSFFVSVECLIDSRLKGKPLIIGGKKGRGVVSSCSYEARKFGVHSAMPVSLALQLCPEAIVIGGDIEAYSKYSKLITEIIAEDAPLFEKSSIDEFYVDVTGLDRFFGCYQWAQLLRTKIMKESGLPISMGLSANKLVSKIATGEAKPNGERWVSAGAEEDFLSPMPIRKLPSLGNRTAVFLNEMGVKTVKVLREVPLDMLLRVFGKNGKMLWNRARGIDYSPVVPYHERKSISTEMTFMQDTIDVPRLKSLIIAMVEKLTHKLRHENFLTSCITVKIRYADFETLTKQKKISYTVNDKTLINYGLEIFDKLYDRRLRIRLIGIRFSNLVHGNYQINLFEDTEQQINLYQAMDKIKDKYGTEKLMRATTLGLSSRVRMDTNPFHG